MSSGKSREHHRSYSSDDSCSSSSSDDSSSVSSATCEEHQNDTIIPNVINIQNAYFNYCNTNGNICGNNNVEPIPGPPGPPGPQGPPGSSGQLMFNFASVETVSNGDYIGMGNSSVSLLRATLIVPTNCNVKKIAFSIRKLSANISYTAILYVNGNPTPAVSIIPNGSTQYSILSDVDIVLNTLDLITIRIEYIASGGALTDGVCVSLLANII